MKKTIKLTETVLRHIIKESVKDYLTELDWKTYANAADKAIERSDMGYWQDNGEDDLNSFKKAVKNRKRTKHFGTAAKNAFNRDYGYENGHYADDDYRSVEMRGDFDATEEFAPNVKGYNAETKNSLGYIKQLTKKSDITPEEYFDGDEEAAQSYRNAQNEFDKFRNNDYKYVKGKGWQ